MKQTKTNIRKIVVEHIASVFAVDAAEVVDNAALVEDLGGDSLDVYEVVFAVEEELDVTVETDTAAIKTVKNMLQLFGAPLAPAK